MMGKKTVGAQMHWEFTKHYFGILVDLILYLI